MLGKKIKQLRIRNNLSQENLANVLGVSTDIISEWESGQSIPDMDAIIALSKIFHVNINEILDFSENNNCKKWNYIYVAVYSIVLWVSGITLLLFNTYLSDITNFEGELSKYSPEIMILSLIFLLCSFILFVFNLLKNRN